MSDNEKGAAEREFAATAQSLKLKPRILEVVGPELADGMSPKLVADAIMGVALDLIQERQGLIAKMVYLRHIADQIEAALEAQRAPRQLAPPADIASADDRPQRPEFASLRRSRRLRSNQRPHQRSTRRRASSSSAWRSPQ